MRWLSTNLARLLTGIKMTEVNEAPAGASRGGDGAEPLLKLRGIDKHFGHPAHLPRAGQPGEIGPVVAFLVSRRNSYMTGANINVDGGSDFT